MLKNPNQNSLNILVAEDNPTNQTLLLAILNGLGHTAHLAADGLEAIEAYHQQCFDIILMDILMPKKNGIDATKDLIQLGCKTPIIGLTTNTLHTSKEHCFEAGMCDYLSKPYKISDLCSVLEKHSS
ncbi:response regulator [bacterium]|nr:response regulator [bacterium]